MLSVSDNLSSDATKRQFLKRLYDAIIVYNDRVNNSKHYIGSIVVLKEAKCVILTTNRKFYLWPFFSSGFSYKGNSSRRARVKFMKFPKGLKYAFEKEGII